MKVFIFITFLAVAFAIPLEDKSDTTSSNENGSPYKIIDRKDNQPRNFQQNIVIKDSMDSEQDLTEYESQADEMIDMMIHPDPRKQQRGRITKEIVQAAINKVLTMKSTSATDGPWKQSLTAIAELQRQQVLQQLQLLQKEQHLQAKLKMQQQQVEDEEQLLVKKHQQEQQDLQKQQLVEQQQMHQKKQLLEQKHQLALKEMFGQQEQMLQDHQLQWDQLRQQVQLVKPPLDVMRAIEVATQNNQANRQQNWASVSHRWTSNLPPQLALRPYMEMRH